MHLNDNIYKVPCAPWKHDHAELCRVLHKLFHRLLDTVRLSSSRITISDHKIFDNPTGCKVEEANTALKMISITCCCTLCVV